MLNGAFDRAEIDVSREEVWSFGQNNVEIISFDVYSQCVGVKRREEI